MTDSLHHGICLCEGVKYTVQGSPEIVFACYCTDCQKNAGSAYQIIAKFNKTDVKVTSGEEFIGSWTIHNTLSGDEKHKVFCKRCGCTLWTIPMHAKGEKYIVRTSLLEGGLEKFKPQMEYFTRSKPGYLEVVEGAKMFDTIPGH